VRRQDGAVTILFRRLLAGNYGYGVLGFLGEGYLRHGSVRLAGEKEPLIHAASGTVDQRKPAKQRQRKSAVPSLLIKIATEESLLRVFAK
jgi:hypothetical protein